MTDDLKLADAIDPRLRGYTLEHDGDAIGLQCRTKTLIAASDALRTRHQSAEIARRAMREEAARAIESRRFSIRSDIVRCIRALPAPLDVEAITTRAIDAALDAYVSDETASYNCARIARAVLFSIIGEGK